VAGPLIERALERQVRADLETLKDLLEERSFLARTYAVRRFKRRSRPLAR